MPLEYEVIMLICNLRYVKLKDDSVRPSSGFLQHCSALCGVTLEHGTLK